MAALANSHFDVVIAGGGAAGCVMANRLSADPTLRVALIEAGPDKPPDHDDQILWDSYPIIAYFDPRHHWTDLRVYTQPLDPANPGKRSLSRYEQGKVMGGGSSINGMMANRGSPADYDEWAALGADGWAWSEVLPYFRKLESDLDFDGLAHGATGPMPIRRVPPETWGGFTQAAVQALADSGLVEIADQNDGFAPGYFPIAINNEDDHRVSTATAYLNAATRARSNLTILSETKVRRILFAGTQVTGIEVVGETGLSTIGADEVIVTAGAIHTPALLLKSGIGPFDQLRSLDIPVICDLSGVGANLQEHPQVAVSSVLAPAARIPLDTRRHIFVGFRYSSGLPDCPPSDMYGVVVNRAAWHPIGQKLGGFLIWVNKAYSRGEVRLTSTDVDREPKVELNLLSDERDLIRLRDGLRRLGLLYQHPEMSAAASHAFPTAYTEKSRNMAIVSRKNWWKTAAPARMLDGPDVIREQVIASKVTGGLSLDKMVQDDAVIDEFLRERVHGTWHCCGTAKMGRADDPAAVVDSAGTVYGLQGLRVADASVMPTVPCANVHIPTIMVAEKIADAVLVDWRRRRG